MSSGPGIGDAKGANCLAQRKCVLRQNHNGRPPTRKCSSACRAIVNQTSQSSGSSDRPVRVTSTIKASSDLTAKRRNLWQRRSGSSFVTAGRPKIAKGVFPGHQRRRYVLPNLHSCRRCVCSPERVAAPAPHRADRRDLWVPQLARTRKLSPTELGFAR